MMEGFDVTTPFGRRSVSLATVKAQIDNRPIQTMHSVDKWRVLRDICDARTRLGLRDRALAVLSALLSFHPVSELSPTENLIVFPSNQQLSARAHGISGTTLRQNLAVLIDAGIINRRDSPNGKRYARKEEGGRIKSAFGFSLAPLVARAAEFTALAQEIAAERQRVREHREQVTLLRRDIRKLISAAIEEDAPGEWAHAEACFLGIVAEIARARSAEELAAIEARLADLKGSVLNQLTSFWEVEKTGGNGDENRHHIQSQKPDSILEFEPALERAPGENRKSGNVSQEGTTGGSHQAPPRDAISPVLPLGMVLRACPEIIAYGPGGQIKTWRDLMGAAVVVRSMLGVSPSAYQDACFVLGQEGAAAVTACILERANLIHSAGGYLRTLTRKAARGEFSLAAMVMAVSDPAPSGRGRASTS